MGKFFYGRDVAMDIIDFVLFVSIALFVFAGGRTAIHIAEIAVKGDDCLEAQSGAVVAKSYEAPKGGLIGSRGEVYRLEISDGSKKAVVSVPESVWEQAEVGDWYDEKTVTVSKAGEDAGLDDIDGKDGGFS